MGEVFVAWFSFDHCVFNPDPELVFKVKPRFNGDNISGFNQLVLGFGAKFWWLVNCPANAMAQAVDKMFIKFKVFKVIAGDSVNFAA